MSETSQNGFYAYSRTYKAAFFGRNPPITWDANATNQQGLTLTPAICRWISTVACNAVTPTGNFDGLNISMKSLVML